MDYLLFHSQFSPSSQKLFDEFPALREKAISVDSLAMRNYVKKIHIVCVPTLTVLLGNRIIDRVIGYDAIYNWFVTTMYRMGQLQATPPPSSAHESSMPMVANADRGEFVKSNNGPSMTIEHDEDAYDHEMESTPATSTSLDDLILEDIPKTEQQRHQMVQPERETPLVQTGISANTMLLAEQLKKERDNNLEGNKKKFSA